MENDKIRTKLLATLGPATSSYEIIRFMMQEGADAFRINFSHGSHNEAEQLISLTRRAEVDVGVSVPIIADLQGPTVRLDDLKQFDVVKGKKYEISEGGEIPLKSDTFYRLVEVGDTVIIDGGKLWAKVESKNGNSVFISFIVEGTLGSKKTVAIQGKEYPLSSPTEKDINDLEFAAEAGMDGIAMSFVKTPEDIEKLRAKIAALGSNMFIVAKIETISAVNNITGIIGATDYVLVARGDLGSHFPMVKIPELERNIIRQSLNYGKPAIVATQLLDSMISNPIPTRAEITDVFMAVSMGADALMVSGETAVGRYPIEVIKWLRDIAKEGEAYSRARPKVEGLDVYDKFAEGVANLGELIGGKLVAMTSTGKTPQRLARFRPKCDIIAVCNDLHVAKKIKLTWGVKPVIMQQEKSEQAIIDKLKSISLIAPGNKIVMTRSLKQGVTDAIRIIEV
ncbi:MAG: pyruvate kinase [Conexivisphaerales archaeon]